MTTTIPGKSQCSSCKKEKKTYKCDECSQYFCSECLPKHEQELNNKLNQIEGDQKKIRGILNDQRKDPSKHSSMVQIDQWENDSKKVIEQRANECRQIVRDYANQALTELGNRLNDIARNFQYIRQKNLFNETLVKEFQEKMDNFMNELNQSSAISIETESASLVPNILVKYSK